VELVAVIRSAVGWTIAILATVVLTLLGLVVAAIPGERLLHHRMARLWGRICVWVTGCPVRIEGLDDLDLHGQYVVMVNHQSALDIPLLMGVLPARWRAVFWAKQSLFRIPVLGWAMRALGHMPIDRVDRRAAGRMLSESIDRAADVRSLLVFPEETYSMDGNLLAFQRGGFVLALKTGMPILPAGINGTRVALPPRQHVIHPATLTVRFGEPIPTADLSVSDRQELMDHTRDAVAALSEAPTREGA
jgi:1-acyl-sn-glycerol-3-phosphate acyltransferase